MMELVREVIKAIIYTPIAIAVLTVLGFALMALLIALRE